MHTHKQSFEPTTVAYSSPTEHKHGRAHNAIHSALHSFSPPSSVSIPPSSSLFSLPQAAVGGVKEGAGGEQGGRGGRGDNAAAPATPPRHTHTRLLPLTATRTHKRGAEKKVPTS